MNTTRLFRVAPQSGGLHERERNSKPPNPESVRALIATLEARPVLESGTDESSPGYAVLGLAFDSGHVLALRRFAASSIGPGYTSVWHRDAQGHWTFYQDVPPRQGCSRCFASEVTENVVAPIQIEWLTSHHFAVHIRGDRTLHWQISLQSAPVTKALNWAGSRLPDVWWRNPITFRMMQAMARVTLRTGRLALAGRLPDGQQFLANPRLLWTIPESRARLNGMDLGVIKPLLRQARLGDFWIPRRGLFAIAPASMERFDATRPSSAFVMRRSEPTPDQPSQQNLDRSKS